MPTWLSLMFLKEVVVVLFAENMGRTKRTLSVQEAFLLVLFGVHGQEEGFATTRGRPVQALAHHMSVQIVLRSLKGATLGGMKAGIILACIQRHVRIVLLVRFVGIAYFLGFTHCGAVKTLERTLPLVKPFVKSKKFTRAPQTDTTR
jgi:hypothetical protein